jgi:hypothetical protein
MKTPLALAFASVALLLTEPQSPVAGKWKVSSNVGGTSSEQACTFTQKDDVVAGTCEGDSGPLPVSGKVDGKNVTWQFNTQWEGQTLTVIYSGALESATKITGRVDVQPLNVSGDFTATQEK